MLSVLQVVDRPLEELGPRVGVRIAHVAELDALIDWLTQRNIDAECSVAWTAGLEDRWPTEEQLAVIAKSSVAAFDIEHTISLSARVPRATVEFIHFLRDAMSFGLKVHWHCHNDLGIDVRLLTHLPPPVANESADSSLRQWQDEHSFGRFYWRRGPEFVLVKDTRPIVKGARYILDDSRSVVAFSRLQDPTELNLLAVESDEIGAAVHLLIDEGIAIQVGGWAVALPYRMRNWPVPYTAV